MKKKNEKLEDLALSALFEEHELIDIKLAAMERHITTADLIRIAVLDDLFA
jgi:hypothetical protein